MKKYNIAFFDLDGTLTDPEVGITTCAQVALKFFGIEEKCENLRKFIGPPLEETFRDTFALGPEKAKIALEKYRERYSEVGLFENRVYDGIPQMLEKVHNAGTRIVLATSKPEIYARRILEKYDLMKYFDEPVGSELDGRRTDKGELIREGLRRLDMTGENCVMVGDRKFDILGGKAAGIHTIGVRYGFADNAGKELETAGADEIADTVAQLTSLLV